MVGADVLKLAEVSVKNRDAHPSELFRSRESKELIVAMSGPLGCGVATVVETIDAVLKEAGYLVTRVKLSDHIEDQISKGKIAVKARENTSAEANRYLRLQDGGNELRRVSSENELLAEWATNQIALTRASDVADKTDPDALDKHVPIRRAYILDQLKHPAEVHLLRSVYRNLFFLLGVLSVEGRRRERLKKRGISDEEIGLLMHRDRNEPDDHGQHLDKTLELADFFLRNDRHNLDSLKTQLKRLVDLMHGTNGISPTIHEFGTYVAYASSLGSACLSRQVGAAILDAGGDVLGTGCNDVPRPGGGLYTTEAGTEDFRCVNIEGRVCSNDSYKRNVKEEIIKALVEGEGMSKDVAMRVADTVYANSRIKDLIEFSRAVHAEMEAIISVARKGVRGLVGSTLYSTTFPCHSCARQIVAAGISQVVYVQPYERSLAIALHGDAITFEPDSAPIGDRIPPSRQKVAFIHFEGVAPRRYIDMFLPQGDRKKDGVAVLHPIGGRRRASPEYLDSYREFELKVVEHWNNIFADGFPKGVA